MNSLLFVLLPCVSFSFILNNGTEHSFSSGSYMTDSHYNTLLDLLYQERQSRHNLEQYVNHLHERLATQEQIASTLNSKIDRQEQSEHTYQYQNEILNNRTEELETNFNLLLQDEKKMKDAFRNMSRIQTELENDITLVKNMKSYSQALVLSNITLQNTVLRNDLEKTDRNVNLLLSNDKARQQDFMAMLAEVNQHGKRLREKVSITACANVMYDLVNYTDVVKFPRVQMSLGIQNVSSFVTTGVFTCEVNGLYIVFANLISPSNDGYIGIYKNSELLSMAYTAFIAKDFDNGDSRPSDW